MCSSDLTRADIRVRIRSIVIRIRIRYTAIRVRIVVPAIDHTDCSGAYPVHVGVSYASAGNGASSTHANVGSRLAFRGKIVRAQSVAAYKAIREVA